MARTNLKQSLAPVLTHEGAPAVRIGAMQELERSLLACMLFEDTFYESGEEIASRIRKLVGEVSPEQAATLAVRARTDFKLRHAPLWVVNAMLANKSHRQHVADVIPQVVQRADELAELLSMYWAANPVSNGKKTHTGLAENAPLAKQLKKGLAAAFVKFDAFQLAKYNRDNAVKLRDVLFLTHAKPKDQEQAEVWKKLVDGKLETPDTWEVELSAGKGENKQESWTRLLTENKLGALALLRNLRNMIQANVDESLIRKALAEIKVERVLPFRFISAARYAPQFEPELEQAMYKCVAGHEKLTGKTILLVDVSGSMNSTVSGKSEISRIDAACGLAILLREICESVEVITFSYHNVVVPSRRGFALRDAIDRSQDHGGTYLGNAVVYASAKQHDRLIVLTDEQSHDQVNAPAGERNYMVNVAAYQNGVGYKPWIHVDGWSESIVNYIQSLEKFGISTD